LRAPGNPGLRRDRQADFLHVLDPHAVPSWIDVGTDIAVVLIRGNFFMPGRASWLVPACFDSASL
jgi:hypothetical protein